MRSLADDDAIVREAFFGGPICCNNHPDIVRPMSVDYSFYEVGFILNARF